jgi:hypothetical protein
VTPFCYEYEIAPEESGVARQQSGPRRPPECDLNGVMLDRHVWRDDGTCDRCKAVRAPKGDKACAPGC